MAIQYETDVMGVDPVGILLESQIIQPGRFQQALSNMHEILSCVPTDEHGRSPYEIQSEIQALSADLSELEIVANGGGPVQRADVLSQIDPMHLHTNLRTIISYLGK
ncbi:MAG: hypothetical protein KKF46_02830 [Nanoarchaeota archaeon]|nr:hypothetical protein [Nanoarchaeota archaeon]MBU1321267.1 hypothetical protein [Nanoarchaeota archaeon]MBU1597338.1 hypothetical protein [Nanoarchaeota archaeon]MBU2441461.1 hypothetical protein [Nanoarchaeota archaeon]